MNEELMKRLREPCQYENCVLCKDAANAIEELSREYESVAASLNESVELVRKLQQPRWIPVTAALPESIDDDVLVTDGEGCAVGYWRPDAQAWDSTDFGWLENRSEPPCGIHTVTHWMPLPPLPESPKE